MGCHWCDRRPCACTAAMHNIPAPAEEIARLREALVARTNAYEDELATSGRLQERVTHLTAEVERLRQAIREHSRHVRQTGCYDDYDRALWSALKDGT